MEFWGVEVKPGETVICEPGYDKYVHISLASLGESKSSGDSIATIYVKVNYQKLVLGTLCAEKCAQINYDLVFENKFELSHTSTNDSVHFCGYKTVAQEYKYPSDRKSKFEDAPVDPNANATMDTILPYRHVKASLLRCFNVGKAVNFSYKELVKATDHFGMNKLIGQGGCAEVYYAKLRGEKTAVKKMRFPVRHDLVHELSFLAKSYHLNLVRLIGYCFKGSTDHFLVFEFIDNGDLKEHLIGSKKDPLTWSKRVQIALDSASGIKYMHEHTDPVYIHRDIKISNILLDKEFHAKVADFDLTRSTHDGNIMEETKVVGTFGYLAPEYAFRGYVSPKVDVFGFGVVLYQLISAKEAVTFSEPDWLVDMFADALSQPEPMKHVRKLVDPRLGESYPVDSVYKMALLGMACTQKDPWQRPSIQIVVLALQTLLTAT